jgi:hypothetical protein
LEHLARRGRITADICVRIVASPTFAIQAVVLHFLLEVAIRALQGVAFGQFSAAFVIRCVGAVHVVAQNIVSMLPVVVAMRAFVLTALCTRHATLLRIRRLTMLGCTRLEQLPWIVYGAWATSHGMALRNLVAAQVSVVVCALETMAM